MAKIKVMAIYAHPADPITDCGGAIAMHAENGILFGLRRERCSFFL